MAGRPTAKTVAAEAGVSTATVSNVLAGRRDRVSDATRERVLAVAARLGYHPNPTAKAIRTGRTNLVLMSMTMLTSPWVQDVVEAVSRRIVGDGLHALVLPNGDWSRVLDQQGADVAFIDQVRPDDRPRLIELARRGLRIVVFDESPAPESAFADAPPEYDIVSSPSGPGCRLAMDHLLASHERIGCLVGTTNGVRSPRMAAYVEAMARAGLSTPESWVEEFTLDTGDAAAAADRLLSQPDRPSAIFATTDYAAMAAVRVAGRMHLAVPEDVAIVGAGNTAQSATMTPSLTSVGPDDLFGGVAELIRRRAVRTDESPPSVHHYPWRLFARDSTMAAQSS